MANRKSGSHDSMTGASRKPEEARADAVLEHQHEDAVGGADRQQVQDDRLERHHDGAEDHQQQQEAEPEHEGEHERQVVPLRLDRVDGLGRRAADEDLRRRRRRRRPGCSRRAAAASAALDSALEKSPGIATVSSARSPASFVSSFEAPKNPSASREAVSSAIAPWTAGSFTSGASMTMSAVSTPSENSLLITSKACRELLSSGSELMPTLPRLMSRTGSAAATSRPPVTTTLMTGRAVTRPGDPVPEAAVALGLAAAADERQRQPVDAVAQQAEHGRQQRHRSEHRRGHDQDRADREAAEGRVRHDQHAGERDRDRHAREEDRAAGRRARGRDRVDLLAAEAPLLAEALHDEERVVDADRETDHRDDEDDEVGHLHHVADQRRGARRHEDREQREHDRQPGRHRCAEHDEQDHERHDDPDHLALLRASLPAAWSSRPRRCRSRRW